MKALYIAFLGLLLAFAIFVSVAFGADAIRLVVTPRFAYAPTRINVVLTIEPQDDNRAYCVYWEGPNAGSSCRTIDGLGAPITFRHELKDLPAGYYTVVGVVYNGTEEKRTPEVDFQILEPGGTPQ